MNETKRAYSEGWSDRDSTVYYGIVEYKDVAIEKDWVKSNSCSLSEKIMDNTNTVITYESKIYMGCQTSLDSVKFTQEQIEAHVGEVQDGYKVIIPLRITPTCFVSGSKYKEEGWEIAAINYPKIRVSTDDIDGFMKHLAESIIKKFNQHRVCVVDSNVTTMFKGLKH
tara:strand:- start:433 stop:936 length:504 start_codon:yes stop_codon:yes gene_type:complete